MSSIIQPVSYNKENAKQFIEKLGELLGVHKLKISLVEGQIIEGIVSEVGEDYIIVIEENFDTIVPLSKILCCRYGR
jgi:hypothetical protein